MECFQRQRNQMMNKSSVNEQKIGYESQVARGGHRVFTSMTGELNPGLLRATLAG